MFETFSQFRRRLNESRDVAWGINDALPSQADPNYDVLKDLFDQGAIWPYNRGARTMEIVFHDKSIIDQLKGEWGSMRGHRVMKYMAANGMRIKMRTTRKAGPGLTTGMSYYQEAGVVLWLDALLHGANDIRGYEPTDFYQSNVDYRDAEAWLGADARWNRDCRNIAIDIIKTFGTHELDRFQCHHRTQEYKDLRKKGAALAGIGEDRWNPSDIMLIARDRRAYTKAMRADNLATLNKFLADPYGDIRGISLKGSKAMHGSVAASSIAGHPLISDTMKRIKIMHMPLMSNTLPDAQKTEVIRAFAEIQRNRISKIYVRGVDGTLTDTIMAWDTVTDLWSKAYPDTLALLMACRDDEDLDNLAFVGFMYASSAINGVSSNYWKAQAGRPMDFVKPSTNRNAFRLDQVIVPVNGEASTVFNATYKGKPVKLQFRSKNSKPQFIIIHDAYNPRDIKPLSKVRIK